MGSLLFSTLLHDFHLHSKQAFIGKSHSQSISLDWFAFEQCFIAHRTNNLAVWTEYVADICYATKFHRTTVAGYVGIVVLGHSLDSFLRIPQRCSDSSNIYHGLLDFCYSTAAAAAANAVVAAVETKILG